MDDQITSTGLHLRENLKGRIENLAMSPSYANTMIPVFEAIMNSIHSIQERFGDDWAKSGIIQVTTHQDQDGNPHSFTVEDNGSGLTKENFDSFLTYDSRLKVKKGGKGVGRLTWLKVFEKVHISSFFLNDDTQMTRTFDFILDNQNALRNHYCKENKHFAELRTTVKLETLKNGYSSLCPKKLETIAHRIVAHFLPFLIGDECPDITITNEAESFKLRQIITDHTYRPEAVTFDIENVGSFSIRHLLLSKSLVEKGAEHTVFLAAHDRIVTDHGINNQTGLDTSFDHEGSQVIYVGIVSSIFLDDNVTQERNNFDITKNTLRLITKKAEEHSKSPSEK